MNKNNRSCPICDSKTSGTILKVDFELFDGHPMNGGYDLVQCGNCGFMYANTPITQDQLDKYYTELSKYEDKTISTGGGYTQNDKDRLAGAARFISNSISDKNLRVLDLGCANGGLLRELKNNGFTNVVGIDPSAQCVEITRNEVGCECYQYSLFDIPVEAGKFDVVILSHVLEHVLNVKQTVNIINNLLNDNGIAYIECPNAAFYYEVIHAPLQEFNTEHINHFTERAFRNLMEAAHFETISTHDKILKIASDQDYHAVYGLFKKNNQAPASAMLFDDSIKEPIRKYIDESYKILDRITETIDNLPSDQPIGLFGIGQFAFKLLKTKPFVSGRKYKLFDNNRMNVGKTINGQKILHGSDILAEYRKEKFTIVISSLIHEMPIRKSIEDTFQKNSIIPPPIIGFFHLLT